MSFAALAAAAHAAPAPMTAGHLGERTAERSAYEVSKPVSRPGYCFPTEDSAGDCSLGSSGSWSGLRTLSECIARCKSCGRCRMVSFARHSSVGGRSDCSWYARCPPTLQTTPAGYHTVEVVSSRDAADDPHWRSILPPASVFGDDAASPGYCAQTVDSGDCTIGDLGYFDGVRSWSACKARCAACPRCAWLSWSASQRDCSWYAECEAADLRRPPANARDYGTLRIRERPAPLPTPIAGTSPPHSLALVTLAVGMGVRCALTQWCYRAEHRFARALRHQGGWNVSLLVIGASNASAVDCPTATFVPVDWRVRSAMRKCGGQQGVGHSANAAGDLNMYKLAALGFTDADLVLFADVDISLVPLDQLGVLAAQWGAGAKLLKRSPWLEFIANADQASPVNGGLWLVRPSQRTLDLALRALGHCRFNASHGWDFVGRPRQLLQNELLMRHPNGAVVTHDVGDHPNRTICARRNSWAFHNGDSDQGLLWYLFYVQRPVGAYFQYSQGKSKALHWIGHGFTKPWTILQQGVGDYGYFGHANGKAHRKASHGGAAKDAAGGLIGAFSDNSTSDVQAFLDTLAPWQITRAVTYFQYSSLGGGPNASACARHQRVFRRVVEDSERFYDLPKEKIGATTPFFSLW